MEFMKNTQSEFGILSPRYWLRKSMYSFILLNGNSHISVGLSQPAMKPSVMAMPKAQIGAIMTFKNGAKTENMDKTVRQGQKRHQHSERAPSSPHVHRHSAPSRRGKLHTAMMR